MLKVIVFIKKRPDLDRAQFQDYYEHHHAPLVGKLLPFHQEYKRNYIGPGVRPGQPASEFDVVTELSFASQERYDAWLQALGDPEILSQIREDERNFLHQGETRMWTVTEFAT